MSLASCSEIPALPLTTSAVMTADSVRVRSGSNSMSRLVTIPSSLPSRRPPSVIGIPEKP